MSVRAVLGAAALVLLILVAGPSRAEAAVCDNTWAGSGSGLWLDNANWIDGDADPNNNVPGLDDNVCITQPGTYTVTIVDNGVFGGGSAKSITVGDGDGDNGTATLSIASSTSGGGNPLGGTLNGLSEPSTIASDGIVELTSVGSNPGQALIQNSGSGEINNSGIFRSVAGSGGSRLFDLNLNNLAGGTVNIAYDATQGFTRTWTNEGTFNVADGATFTFTGNGGGPTFTHSGGTLDTNATGTFFQSSGFFNHTGGTTSGTKPIQLCGPRLTAPSGGAGAYDFVRVPASFCGGGTINGDIGAGKTVRLNNDSNAAMGVSLTGDLANDGTLILTGPSEDQLLGGFTLTNNGTLRTEGSGARLFGINLTNAATGSVEINQDAAQGFTSTWTNNGSFEVADGEQFTLTGNGGGPTFNQAGGTLETNATGTYFQSGGFFNHTGGATSGSKPIQLCGPQLSAPSGGAGAYDFVRVPASFCGGGTINGDIGAGKTVRLNNDSDNAMGVSLTGSLANNGTLILTGSAEDQFLGGFTLTNNGTLQVTGSGGRLVGNSITNSATGTIDVDQDVNFGFTPTITNNGAIDVADGKTMYVTGSGQGPTFNQSGGTVATNTSGVLLMTGGTFNHTGGSQSGNPVQLCGPQLNAPSGGAAAYDFVRLPASFCGGGTIGANIGAGKVVRMNNDSNGTMGVSLAAAIANNGTLTLTGSAEDQLLGGFTLTNNGTLQVTGSGARLVGNSITNSATGTIDVDQDVNFGFTPTVTNDGAIDVAAGETMFITGSGGGPVYNQSGGTMNVAGTLNHGGAYNHSGGTTTVAAGGLIQTNGNNVAMSGGTLRGAGTATVGTLNNTGGTVHPGASPGILTITGNYTQGAGGTLAAEVAGTTPGSGYSRLAVSGGAALDGELDVTNTVAPAGGSELQVLTAAGGRSGTFSTVDVHGTPGYDTAYNGNDVTLMAHQPPAAPNLTGTNPASGSNDNSPNILGSAVAGSTVKVYDNAGCTGTPVATGTAAQLAGAGIEVTVADNSTTTFRATATNGDGTSSCSAARTYVEDSRPAAPTLSGTDPASGADDNAPKIKGSAPAGTTVRIYSNAGCTGTPVATGSAADLAGAGIEVTVADNSTTTFRATATNAGGTSSCSSSSATYAEVTPAPAGEVDFGKQPPKKSKKKKATFKFSAPDAASYECKLDKKPLAPCTSPVKLKKLKKGKHKFSVRAIGEDGLPGPTTTYKWKVKKKT